MSVRASRRRRQILDWWRGVEPALRPAVIDRLGARDGDAFLARADVAALDLHDALDEVYAPLGVDVDGLAVRLLHAALDLADARPEALRVLDTRRTIDPQWFLSADTIGYVAYTDRYNGTLSGVVERLDHLDALGVRYLHLMPLLRTRDGDDDGGYAVADYDAVDPALGTIADLEALAAAVHDRDMALCVDVVVNHTAAEHEWAERARAGDAAFRNFYLVFDDRTLPDRYEQTLREVFPTFAPGNFTEVDGLGWVWTTFNEWQWDLNYANPEVLVAMVGVIGRLANRGVDVLRLDAVPFLWKRMGTDCENQPEAHHLLRAMRAVLHLAAPGVVFKAEAIVPPDQLVQYLGGHERQVRECELAYHNQLMVMLWSSLAARDGRLIAHSLHRMDQPPDGTGWVTYVRCHDDIGWAVTDENAGAVGWSGFEHRRFLNDFYAGDHPGSWASGARFQVNETTGDARISGTAAALAGLDAARRAGDDAAVEAAIARLVLLYSVIYSWGGSIPLVYMGDEIGLPNDLSFADRPDEADDNRWMHRPAMDWNAVARRHEAGTVEQRIFDWFRRLGQVRRDLLVLESGGATRPLDSGNDHVFAYTRHHRRAAPFVAACNFSDGPTRVGRHPLDAAGLSDPVVLLAPPGAGLDADGIQLPAWGFLWLSG